MSKYKNPINKTEMVSLPRWEYARLVESFAKLRIIERLSKEVPSYQWEGVVKLLFEKEEE